MTEEYKKYSPSSATEGHAFVDQLCGNFRDESFDEDDDNHCEIINQAMIYSIEDAEYPCQWVIGKKGPRCTSFEDKTKEPGQVRCEKTIDLFEKEKD